jgi:hypothetical protein
MIAAVAAGEAAQPQVLVDRELDDDATPLRHVREAAADDVLDRDARDVLAGQRDRAGLRPDQAVDRAQQARLAGAVRAQDRGDRALRHRQPDAVQCRHRPVGDGEVLHREHARGGGCLRLRDGAHDGSAR